MTNPLTVLAKKKKKKKKKKNYILLKTRRDGGAWLAAATCNTGIDVRELGSDEFSPHLCGKLLHPIIFISFSSTEITSTGYRSGTPFSQSPI
jgi:hypothetical protein